MEDIGKLTFQELLSIIEQLLFTEQSVSPKGRQENMKGNIMNQESCFQHNPYSTRGSDMRCVRCRKNGHSADRCYYKKFVCYFCNRYGHKASECFWKCRQNTATEGGCASLRSQVIEGKDKSFEHASENYAQAKQDFLTNIVNRDVNIHDAQKTEIGVQCDIRNACSRDFASQTDIESGRRKDKFTQTNEGKTPTKKSG